MKISYHLIIVIFISSWIFTSCKSNEQPDQENEKIQQQLDDLTESMEDIDETIELADYLNTQLEQLDKQVESGELTREQANKLAEELNKTYQREIAKRSNINPATKLPPWAEKLGLSEPKGLTLDPDFSKKTSLNDPDGGFNSIRLVYRGDYGKAIKQARIIAEKANIPLSKEYAEAYEMAKKYPSAGNEIKGISFMNYDLSSHDIRYKISITVNAEGILTISAVDEEQRKVYLNNR